MMNQKVFIFQKSVTNFSLIICLLSLFIKNCNPFPCLVSTKCDPAVFKSVQSSNFKALPKAVISSIPTIQSNFTEQVGASPGSSSSSSSLLSKQKFPFLLQASVGPVPEAMIVPFPETFFHNEKPVNGKGPADNSNSNQVLKLDKEYTPSEIAEYIYSTGDENGISQIVYEMVQDGQILTSQDDVIHFLEAVQTHLAKMREKHLLDSFPEEKDADGRNVLGSYRQNRIFSSSNRSNHWDSTSKPR